LADNKQLEQKIQLDPLRLSVTMSRNLFGERGKN